MSSVNPNQQPSTPPPGSQSPQNMPQSAKSRPGTPSTSASLSHSISQSSISSESSRSSTPTPSSNVEQQTKEVAENWLKTTAKDIGFIKDAMKGKDPGSYILVQVDGEKQILYVDQSKNVQSQELTEDQSRTAKSKFTFQTPAQFSIHGGKFKLLKDIFKETLTPKAGGAMHELTKDEFTKLKSNVGEKQQARDMQEKVWSLNKYELQELKSFTGFRFISNDALQKLAYKPHPKSDVIEMEYEKLPNGFIRASQVSQEEVFKNLDALKAFIQDPKAVEKSKFEKEKATLRPGEVIHNKEIAKIAFLEKGTPVEFSYTTKTNGKIWTDSFGYVDRDFQNVNELLETIKFDKALATSTPGTVIVNESTKQIGFRDKQNKSHVSKYVVESSGQVHLEGKTVMYHSVDQLKNAMNTVAQNWLLRQ